MLRRALLLACFFFLIASCFARPSNFEKREIEGKEYYTQDDKVFTDKLIYMVDDSGFADIDLVTMLTSNKIRIETLGSVKFDETMRKEKAFKEKKEKIKVKWEKLVPDEIAVKFDIVLEDELGNEQARLDPLLSDFNNFLRLQVQAGSIPTDTNFTLLFDTDFDFGVPDDNIAVGFQQGSSIVEIDRYIEHVGNRTRIWFRAQENIPANQSTNKYFVFYDGDFAEKKNASNVFIVYEGFESPTSFTFSTDCGAVLDYVNDNYGKTARIYVGSCNATSLTKNFAQNDYYNYDFLMKKSSSIQKGGMWTRLESNHYYYGATNTNNPTYLGYGLYGYGFNDVMQLGANKWYLLSIQTTPTFDDYNFTDMTNGNSASGTRTGTFLRQDKFRFDYSNAFSASNHYIYLDEIRIWRNPREAETKVYMLQNFRLTLAHVDANGARYSDRIDYTLEYICSTPSTFYLKIDGNIVHTTDLDCDMNINSLHRVYFPNKEGLVDLNFHIIDTDGYTDVSQDDLNIDLYAPNNDTNFTIVENKKLNVKMKCDGGDFNTINTHRIKRNNNIEYQTSKYNRELLDVNINFVDGLNVFETSCIDILDRESETLTFETKFYKKNFYFVRTKTGTKLVDKTDYTGVNDVNQLWLFDTDANTYIDMYTPGKVDYYKETTNNSASIVFITKYNNAVDQRNDFDIDVPQDANIPVCFEAAGGMYEQRFVSSSTRRIMLRHSTSKCYYFATRTKYAFGDYKHVSTFITPGAYDLWVENDDGELEKIGLTTGNDAQQINIDSLLLINKEYQVNLNGELISARFSCSTDCNMLTISYLNTKYDNNTLKISVHKELTEIYSIILDDANVNKAFLVLDTSEWDINNSTIEIRATSRKQNGETGIVRFYYHTALRSSSRTLNPWLAVVGALVVFGVGFTIVHAKVALGWFGIVVVLLALFVTSFGGQEWYVVIVQAILLIIGLYVMLSYKNEASVT